MRMLTQVLGATVVGVLLLGLVWHYSAGNVTEGIALFREEARHIYGDPKAPITIVEFSDVECPFCARLHPTLERIVDESSGTINWEYRHLPLPSHENAELGARALECVSELTNNDTFWQYLDQILKDQGQHSRAYFERVATAFNVPETQFIACLESSRYDDQIKADAAAAAAFGGRGTPFSVIAFPDGSVRPVSGALPYEQWMLLLQQ